MNYYDDERHIISKLQLTVARNVCFVNMSRGARKFFLSLYREKKFKWWTDSSGKNELPPDFYSEKYKYMLEVMRVDDFVMGDNSPNALESKFVKKVEDLRREKGLPPMKDSNIHMLIIPDMSKASENNYKTYVKNFKRIVNKHLEKIDSYRKNHPGYKLGFLIFDESPGYLKAEEPHKKRRPGELIFGFQHYYIRDKKLVETFLYSDLDFVIWMTPNKNMQENPRIYPEICIFDLKKYRKQKERMVEYDYDELVCLEVRG